MTTLRDNVVFLSHPLLESAVVIDNSLTVTKGQPYRQPKVTVDKDLVVVNLPAGRKKSSPVANKFNSLSTETIATRGGGSGSPKELNFFFSLGLTFTDGTSTIVHLGQGSYGVRNNWWIGFTSDKFDVEPSSLSEVFDGVFDAVPEKYKGIAKDIGNVVLGELFGTVNVFKLS